MVKVISPGVQDFLARVVLNEAEIDDTRRRSLPAVFRIEGLGKTFQCRLGCRVYGYAGKAVDSSHG